MADRRARLLAAIATALSTAAASAGYTNNIVLTGYWPPTNNMIRDFSTNPDQNSRGWIGENWEGRGYNVHSFFPEFPDGIGKGEGDLEVDYQDTSEDFWRIMNDMNPVAIITFSRGSIDRSWEVEFVQRNLETWVNDYQAPRQPTPSPPDGSVPAGYVRESTLPVEDIASAVNADSSLGINAFVDYTGYGGGFLSEFIAYHGTWYHSLHEDPSDPFWNVAAGHVHVGGQLTRREAFPAVEITLREVIRYVDSQLPEPTTLVLLAVGGVMLVRRRA